MNCITANAIENYHSSSQLDYQSHTETNFISHRTDFCPPNEYFPLGFETYKSVLYISLVGVWS